jgi:hypothetical protein
MGDDAEYYIEQQEQEARFKQASEYAALDSHCKPLLCWAGLCLTERFCPREISLPNRTRTIDTLPALAYRSRVPGAPTTPQPQQL